MKALITIVLIFAIWWVGKNIFSEYRKTEDKQKAAERSAAGIPADGLDGLPPQFESSLETAKAQGAVGLKNWLDRYRPYVRDPKLAAIELEYAMMITRSNPAEAKRIYNAVRVRTPLNSPVYPQVKKLEATYR